MVLVQVTFDRAIIERQDVEVLLSRVPTESDYILIGESSHAVRTVHLIADPREGDPVAIVRVKL